MRFLGRGGQVLRKTAHEDDAEIHVDTFAQGMPLPTFNQAAQQPLPPLLCRRFLPRSSSPKGREAFVTDAWGLAESLASGNQLCWAGSQLTERESAVCCDEWLEQLEGETWKQTIAQNLGKRQVGIRILELQEAVDLAETVTGIRADIPELGLEQPPEPPTKKRRNVHYESKIGVVRRDSCGSAGSVTPT